MRLTFANGNGADLIRLDAHRRRGDMFVALLHLDPLNPHGQPKAQLAVRLTPDEAVQLAGAIIAFAIGRDVALATEQITCVVRGLQ